MSDHVQTLLLTRSDFVFDSTGTALEDVAAAALVYENATASGDGERFAFGA